MTADGRRARDTGIRSALDHRGANWDRQVIDQAVKHLARTGRVWSVDQLRSILPPVDGQLMGARILAAAKAGTIERVGTTTVRHAAGHARRVATWRGTGQPPPDTPQRPLPAGPARPARCGLGYLVASDGSCCPQHAEPENPARCAVCGQPMTVNEPGQTRHPMCAGEPE
jgi:hypothetical protein